VDWRAGSESPATGEAQGRRGTCLLSDIGLGGLALISESFTEYIVAKANSAGELRREMCLARADVDRLA